MPPTPIFFLSVGSASIFTGCVVSYFHRGFRHRGSLRRCLTHTQKGRGQRLRVPLIVNVSFLSQPNRHGQARAAQISRPSLKTCGPEPLFLLAKWCLETNFAIVNGS